MTSSKKTRYIIILSVCLLLGVGSLTAFKLQAQKAIPVEEVQANNTVNSETTTVIEETCTEDIKNVCEEPLSNGSTIESITKKSKKKNTAQSSEIKASQSNLNDFSVNQPQPTSIDKEKVMTTLSAKTEESTTLVETTTQAKTTTKPETTTEPETTTTVQPENPYKVSNKGMICPLQYDDVYISSKYGPSPLGYRRSICICTKGTNTTMGKEIRAAADGVVMSAEYHSSWGNNIYIKHNSGITNDLYTRYSHCAAMLVKTGDVVKQGQVIGYVGQTGNCTGPLLGFEVWKDGTRIDPEPYIIIP